MEAWRKNECIRLKFEVIGMGVDGMKLHRWWKGYARMSILESRGIIVMEVWYES